MPEDIITQINNTPVRNSDEFVNAVSKLKKNTVARVALIRQGQRAILGLRIQ
jgi:serine protease Do